METLQQALDYLEEANLRENGQGDERLRTPPRNYLDQVGEEEFLLPTRMDAVNQWLEQTETSPRIEMTNPLLTQEIMEEERNSDTNSDYSTEDTNSSYNTTSPEEESSVSSTTTREELEPEGREVRPRNEVPPGFLYEENEEDKRKEKEMDKKMKQKARYREISRLNRDNRNRREKEIDRNNIALRTQWKQANARQVETKKAIRTLNATIKKLKKELKAVEGQAKAYSGSHTAKQTGEMEEELRILNQENQVLRQQRGQPDIHRKLYHDLEKALHLDCDRLPDCPRGHKKTEAIVTSSTGKGPRKPKRDEKIKKPKSTH